MTWSVSRLMTLVVEKVFSKTIVPADDWVKRPDAQILLRVPEAVKSLTSVYHAVPLLGVNVPAALARPLVVTSLASVVSPINGVGGQDAGLATAIHLSTLVISQVFVPLFIRHLSQSIPACVIRL